MGFHSDAQRRAVFARLSGLRREGRQSLHTLQGRAARAGKATVGAVGALALGAALNPSVTHEPLRRVLPRYGPFLGAYTAIPVAATLAAQRGRRTGWKRRAREVGAVGLTGAGSWFGERAMLHSLPVLAPKTEWVRKLGYITSRYPRAVLGLTHGVPLGIAAAASLGLADRLVRGPARSRKARRALVRRSALYGTGTMASVIATREATQYLTGRLPRKFNYGIQAAEYGAIPAYLALQAWRAHRQWSHAHA